jgi:hypothetical protein
MSLSVLFTHPSTGVVYPNAVARIVYLDVAMAVGSPRARATVSVYASAQDATPVYTGTFTINSPDEEVLDSAMEAIEDWLSVQPLFSGT